MVSPYQTSKKNNGSPQELEFLPSLPSIRKVSLLSHYYNFFSFDCAVTTVHTTSITTVSPLKVQVFSVFPSVQRYLDIDKIKFLFKNPP